MSNKKRSLAQRIGETGEALVKLWASRNFLSANKLDNDYGFDFILQHFKPYGKHQIHTGLWFLSQCKAIEEEKPKYVKIERTDAYLYLSASVPFCLVSVNNKSEAVKYRFIDQVLVDKLIDFIHSNNETINLNIDDWFYETAQLQDHIKSYTNNFATQKLKIYTAKKLLNKFSPDITVKTFTTDEYAIVHLDSKWLTTVINPDLLFDKETKSIDDIIDFNVVEILNKYLPSFNVVSITGSIGTDRVLSAFNSKIKTMCISYPHKGEVSYRTKSGFVLTAGPCIKENGQHIHKVKFEVKPSPYSLSECRDDCLAFEEMFKKKQLAIDNHVLIPDLRTWKKLEEFLFIAKEISNAINTGIFEFPGLQACDIDNRETSITIGVITTLINKKTLAPWFPGFLFNCTQTPIEDLEEITRTGRVPLAFSIKQNKYIAWLASSYSWLFYKNQNQIIGFKINQISSVEINKLEWKEREILLPELWLESSWPGIPLSNQYTKVNFTNEIRPFSIIENQCT